MEGAKGFAPPRPFFLDPTITKEKKTQTKHRFQFPQQSDDQRRGHHRDHESVHAHTLWGVGPRLLATVWLLCVSLCSVCLLLSPESWVVCVHTAGLLCFLCFGGRLLPPPLSFLGRRRDAFFRGWCFVVFGSDIGVVCGVGSGWHRVGVSGSGV